ncbi:hypothetical protein VTI28DRAFT_3711 [Corynascus sepedonium]
MGSVSRFRAQLSSLLQHTPLPADVAPNFQSWHEFDEVSNRWRTVGTAGRQDDKGMATSPQVRNPQEAIDRPFNLVTWNVDYSSPSPAQRLSAILSRTFSLSPATDIIFLQEVCKDAFLHLLEESEVRRNWILSDADAILPAHQLFTTITLLSKARFQNLTFGPVWRVNFPSRFGRDALCCDVFVPSSASKPGSRLRLINVHLDSLPIQPSLRTRQLSIVAALLRSAGRGVVAGDFNPVLPADGSLVSDNGLVDAWAELHPDDPGFTWGVDGTEPFPPSRLDKVASIGLKVQHIEILSPGYINDHGHTEPKGSEKVAWSDHSGLTCRFQLAGL